MKVLYDGFDLCNPSTSVSMTINGPAPAILAMFMNTAVDQQLGKFEADNGRAPTDDEAQKIRAWALANVRGTVQADILKEDQNPSQGAFIIDELTELVEEAVLKEFEKIADRGGVLGAMETGVNTFRNPHGDPVPEHIELARSTDEEKQGQLTRLRDFHKRHAAASGSMLERLQQAVIDNANVFEVLMDAVRVCSLGQITSALFEVGGQYRRSM